MSKRICMWSGPRNVSTAMMRSWEARGDCHVSDEPLYAYYLHQTGLDHPCREEVIRSQSRDWAELGVQLSAAPPQGKALWFQKHMAHHLLTGLDRGWMRGCLHCFLIRDPRAVVASYVRARPEVIRRGTDGVVQVDLAPEELGFLQQAELLRWAEEELGQRCPVVDSADLLHDPAPVLEGLCEALGVPWTEGMLSWAPGPRETDGVWARHWYANVERSSGFVPRAQAKVELDPVLEPVVEELQAAYEMLRQRCITG